MIKFGIFLFILLIFFALFKGLFHLVKEGGGQSQGTLKALTWRVGLTAALFIIVMLAGALGWIKPHALQAPLLDSSSVQNQVTSPK